jgi:signal transduction histidine kinase
MDKQEQTIFIIDDNPEDRSIIRRYLIKDVERIYHIFEGETGEQSLALCQQNRPDCILLDYNLPDMNGVEFLAELADDAGSVPFPVVILTGVSDESIAIQAMQNGAQDYLVKGNITTENLHRAIQNAIERVYMLRTLEAQRRDLEQKNQELQAFAYALAHDLRAPLRAISGFAQIVKQDYQPSLDENGQHYVDNIVKACSQMDRLIDDLLSYTRIEHGTVLRQPVNLYSLVMQIVDSLSERVTATGASITVPTNLPVVQGDKTLLSQIFINLLDNALIYHLPDEPPQVTVTCTSTAQVNLICVTDKGIGISPKHYDRIFNTFQRLHSNEEYAGTGIGLAIVKKSAELMGGQVWVESTPGQGSTFFVKLPV